MSSSTKPQKKMPQARRNRRATNPRVKFYERLSRWIISAGGLAVIAAVLGISVFILIEALPLIRGAQSSQLPDLKITTEHENLLAMATDEYQEKAIFWTSRGQALLYDLSKKHLDKKITLVPRATVVRAWTSLRDGNVALALNDGRLWTGRFEFETAFDDQAQRIQTASIRGGTLYKNNFSSKPGEIHSLTAHVGEDESLYVTLMNDGRIFGLSLEKEGGFAGPSSVTQMRFEIKANQKNKALSIALANQGQDLLVGTQLGDLRIYRIEKGKADFVQILSVTKDQPLQILRTLLGDQTIVVGANDGTIVDAFKIEVGGLRSWKIIHRYEPMPGGVTQLAASPRHKLFAAASSSSLVRWYYLSNATTRMNQQLKGALIQTVLIPPRGDGLLLLRKNSVLSRFTVDDPHPEFKLSQLFAQLWYEAYPKPEYVWQSSSGSDDFEPKFSLVPLILGTMKGAIFAMLFAIPIAVLGAIYTSQFMSPRLRKVVKPSVEFMAALPSVVLGFLGALFFAPLIEKNLLTTFLLVVAQPLLALGALLLYRTIPRTKTRFWSSDVEASILIAGMAAGSLLLLTLSPSIEKLFFGDFKIWLNAVFGFEYDPRNSLVVGFIMGFAVVPIIYTLCEDALSSVPGHLTSASLSCGASQWQTAWRVVLPVALSGIYSAVMIGFGRAVGETMIVLMVTGNTAIMDLSAFTGFRAMSANIAVEIPEAPVGGTLYRILFLSGILLFFMTFAVNTVAELIRLRLRRKFKAL